MYKNILHFPVCSCAHTKKSPKTGSISGICAFFANIRDNFPRKGSAVLKINGPDPALTVRIASILYMPGRLIVVDRLIN
jgi:hypothetical protein